MRLLANILSYEQTELDNLHQELLFYIEQFLTLEQIDLVNKAIEVAVESKQNVRSHSGKLSLVLTFQVALIVVKEIGLGKSALIGSLLYDAAARKSISLEEINETYGDKILVVVEGLLQAQELYKKVSMVESDHFKDFLLTFSKDVQVVLVIIAIRLFSMRNLKTATPEMQQRLSHENNVLYAPLAHKLGLYSIKTELEDLSLKYLQPSIYFEIAQKLNENKRLRDQYIQVFIEPLKEKLTKMGLHFEIKGRTKSIHSIYNKVYKQGTRFEDVYDLFAIRIILDSPLELEKSACWQVYSVVTDMYVPNTKRLRDWLSLPKANGYESLHITVMGPQGKWVEVQIRTQRMNVFAEKGLAAHWLYKGVKKSSLDQWLHNIREILEDNTANSSEVMEDVQLDLKEEEIFIFTPKGEVRRFPKGATILDFAFDIHTQVGSKCTGAIVNGKNVSFKYVLHSGDQIELNTSASQTPKADWLNMVSTSKARNKIKQALREHVNKEAELGKEIIKRRFKNWKLELNEMALGKYIRKWGKKTITDFYAAVHNGIIDPVEVREMLYPHPKEDESLDTFKENRTIENYVPKHELSSDDVLTIDNNLTNILYRLSKCCHPIYGDLIFGFVTTGEGIKIHKQSCPNALQMKERFPHRIVQTEWSGTAKHQYLTRLRIIGNDDIGIISNISSVLSSEFKVSIHSISVDSKDGIFHGMLTIPVENTYMLKKILQRIAQVKGVLRAERLES